MDHDCFRKLTQDLEPRLNPVRQSKLLRSLIPTEKKLAEKSIIERLAKVKAVVVSYDLWMSRKTEKIFMLTAHYCTGPQINNTHICMPSNTANDGDSLSLSVMEVVENFGLEIILWGLRVMVVAIFGFVGR